MPGTFLLSAVHPLCHFGDAEELCQDAWDAVDIELCARHSLTTVFVSVQLLHPRCVFFVKTKTSLCAFYSRATVPVHLLHPHSVIPEKE